MRIMKFGGTSVGTGSAIDRTATILATAQREEGPIVAVVSAMSGITNLLLDTAERAAQGQVIDPAEFRWALSERHLAVVGELIRDPHRSAEVSSAISALAERCARLIESVQVLEDLSPRVRDWIVSFGERMCATLVAAVLADRAVPSEPVESDRLIVTDSDYGNGSPMPDQTRELVAKNLRPVVDRGVLPVVTGFFGANSDGVTVTLGRGGSDFSAAILGNALDAEEVVIWTDVDGVMTADPRLVREARTLPSVTYAEARELAYFGAK
ncbi:MAG TPA: aspartate kinase, partial [Thermomicrobiaceae bacterium]|nr:aspartate kinase [Thermomicrobiaceae bacterium]